MNFKNCFYVPLCGALVLFAMAGCADDDLTEGQDSGVRPVGNGIVFGATAGYDNDPSVRTSYGDYDDESAPTSQAINWESGDRVDIYSPESPNVQKVEYEIGGLGGADTQNPDMGSGYLAAYNGQNGLQWTSQDTEQNFYAIYPSKESMTNTTIKNMVDYEEGVFTGYVPINQQHTIEKRDGKWTAKPNMDYLYMAAVNENFMVPTDGTDGGVSLKFKPLPTTLEITLVGQEGGTPISSLNVETNGVPVVGHFTCNLTDPDKRDQEGYPICESTQQGTTNDYATVSLYGTDYTVPQNPENVALHLAPGEEITFNVFLLPTAPLNNVTIRIAGFNAGSKRMTLKDPDNGTAITLNPHKKTRVKIPVPIIGNTTNEWLSGLDNNVLISQISIPGTANSFSYAYEGDNASWYKTQTANFTQQWNSGIRCFELVCPEPSSDNGNLGGVRLQCNRTDLGVITFKDAVDSIWNRVQGTGEFAMIIATYESGTGHPTGDGGYTGVRRFMRGLNNFYKSFGSGDTYITYRPNITLGEARGKLMFIARVTSEEDEDGANLDAPAQGVVINGWGSLKDMWKRRGYDYPDWAVNGDWGEKYMEYAMTNDKSNRSATYSFIKPEKGATNFLHGSVRAGGGSTTDGAYVQYWPRVVKESKNYVLYTDMNYQVLQGWKDNYTQYCYWHESFNEKCDDVWATFEKAIEANNNQQADQFYINSLDGFYVDEDIQLSCTPYIDGYSETYQTGGDLWDVSGESHTLNYGQGGTAGNIAAFATDINDYFYNRLLTYGTDNIYGPMGVTIMDYVYADEPGSMLPSIIINNNYRFPLLTADKVTQSDVPALENGGNVIE